jgi:hypothetical protein
MLCGPMKGGSGAIPGAEDIFPYFTGSRPDLHLEPGASFPRDIASLTGKGWRPEEAGLSLLSTA